MINHCSSMHNCKNQYQCTHCPFTSVQLCQIMSHIDDKHSGKARGARNIFHKIANGKEDEADIRPLWQRDDPTRIRHIRGILMEDEEESEQYRKRLRLDEDDKDDDEDDCAIEESTVEQVMKSFGTI